MNRVLAVVAAAAPLLALALAVPASASTGKPAYSIEEAGYQASGAQFRHVQVSTFLRNPAQYSGSLAAYGLSVQLRSPDRVMVLGVSDTTTSGTGFSPAAAVFNAGSHALIASSANGTLDAQWCPAGGTCQPATSGGSFAPGDTVTESVAWNKTTTTAHFNVYDAAGNLFTAFWHRGAAESWTRVRIGAETGADPWTPGSFTPPPTVQKLAAFSGASLTTYSGSKGTLASWWVHSKLIMTSDGTPTGTFEASPTNLGAGGSSFSVNLLP